MNQYKLIIKGHLDRRYAVWLGAVDVVHLAGGDTAVVSQIPDQAALYGLLMRCRDLGLTLLAMNALPRDDEPISGDYHE